MLTRFPTALETLCLTLALATVGCDGAPLAILDAGQDGSAPSDGQVHDGAVDAGDGGAPDADLACQGVPATGRCEGEVLRTCPGGTLTDRDCAAESLRCVHAAGEVPRCGPEPADCADLPVGGQCVGDQLFLCHAAWLRQLDCANLGGHCGVSGSRPGCETGPGADRVCTGTVTADRRPYDENGLGSVHTGPAVGVTVVVLRGADDAPLGFGVTDDQGRFSIPYDIAGGPDGVYLRVSTLNFTASHRTWVTDDGDATYSYTTPVVDDSGGQPQIDLHVTEAQDAGALNIFGVMVQNTNEAASLLQTLLPPLQAYWERGRRLYCGTCHSTGRIWLLGEPDDTDEYDNSVISHEFGHYLAWAVSRDDSPGGAHDGTPTDPRLAWSEGLATWIGLQLLNESVYIDTKATGATVRDPEDQGWDADPGGPLDQDLSEFVVLESLWDITDPVDATDPMARPALDVFGVLTGYLPSANLVDRAHPGVDFVDFLDGWFCAGLGDAAGINSLVVSGQGFPYDFAGPSAPCPKPTEPARLSLRLGHTRTGVPRVELTVVDHRSSPDVRARWTLPPGRGPVHSAQGALALGPTRTDRPLRASWPLPRGPAPAWVRVGVSLDRGSAGVDHLTSRLWLHPRVTPRPRKAVRRIHLGGLLTLRIANARP